MSAGKRVRWQCPNDLHPAVLGSTRPPRTALVRYCLPCSVAAGRLVERIAPALERRRAAATARQAAKAKAKRQRAAAGRVAAVERETERFTVEGVDLRDELRTLCRLKAFGGARGRLAKRTPDFTVRRHQRQPRRWGVAYRYPWRIHLALWPTITLAQARETIVHELTHLACRPNEHHGVGFVMTLNRARAEAGLDGRHPLIPIYGRADDEE